MPPERPEIARKLDNDSGMQATARMHPDGLGPMVYLHARFDRGDLRLDFTAEQFAEFVAWGQEALDAGYGPEPAAALSPGDQA
jgi:hypothetical protein